ncbi:hypothetical protein [Nocardia brevicatena]|nr:hypothetical protein [Nocardia brevicatena]
MSFERVVQVFVLRGRVRLHGSQAVWEGRRPGTASKPSKTARYC